MIAADLMYFDQLRASWKRTLAITVGVALTTSIVISAPANWRALPMQFVYQMIISSCVGSLFWPSAPVLNRYTERWRPGSRWAMRIAGAAVTLNVGIIIGLAALTALDVLPWTVYWSTVRDSVVPTTVF